MNKRLVAFLILIMVFIANAPVVDAFALIPDGVATTNCNSSVLGTDSGVVYFRAKWTLNNVVCLPGTYLKPRSETCSLCKENSYCIGSAAAGYPDGYPYIDNEYADSVGIASCEGLKSPAGSKSANDCGYILHVGNGIIYMHQDGIDKPRMAIKIGTQTYYANMGSSEPKKAMSSVSPNTKLHITVDGVDYTVYDNSMK